MINVEINNQVVGTFNSIAESHDSGVVTDAQIKVFESEFTKTLLTIKTMSAIID